MAPPSPLGEHPSAEGVSGEFLIRRCRVVSCPTYLGSHAGASAINHRCLRRSQSLTFACDTAREPSQKPADSSNTKHKMNDDDAGVRFSATVEITPAVSAATIVNEPSTNPAERDESSSFTEVAADQLQAFTKSLHGRSLQELRMNTCHFEAFSLPPSRVCDPVPLFSNRRVALAPSTMCCWFRSHQLVQCVLAFRPSLGRGAYPRIKSVESHPSHTSPSLLMLTVIVLRSHLMKTSPALPPG